MPDGAAIIKVKFEGGIFVPLTPVPLLQSGDRLEFRLPDTDIIYLCEADRLAAVESGRVVWTHLDNEGVDSSNAVTHP
jgi:predicted DNA-binding antitoxin AbrB/MazE fold protein